MTNKNWPKLKEESSGIIDGCWDGGQIIPNKTACKHGHQECAICGTTNKRDTKHTTKGGKGVVAKLLGKKKK